MGKDLIAHTEGLRRQAQDIICAAYNRGFKDGDKHETVKWIPTSERLPEPEVMVLVTTKTVKGVRSVNRAYYMDGFWHGSGSMANVTAWMQLPEPYVEK